MRTQPGFPFPSKPENIPSTTSILLKAFACSYVPVVCNEHENYALIHTVTVPM